MSSEPRELSSICERLSEAERAEVTDFARSLLARHEDDPSPRTLPHGLIRHTKGVVGGNACVRNTRIPVWTLVQLKKLGRSEVELIADFPGLTREDLDAVWTYYPTTQPLHSRRRAGHLRHPAGAGTEAARTPQAT